VQPESLEEIKPISGPSTRIPVSPTDHMVISDKSLFLESRSLQTASAAPVVETAPQLNPKPILMGVAQVGAEPRAFIQTLRAQPGQRPTMTLRLGQIYEGYKVSNIKNTRVELSYTSPSGNVTTQVLDIHDDSKRGMRAAIKTPLAQSQVISIGGPAMQPAGGSGQPPGAQGPAVDDQGRRVLRTPFGDIVQGANQGLQQRGPGASPMSQRDQLLQQIQQQEMQARPDQQMRTATPVRRNEVIDDQGRRVIRTPFGDIVRPPEPTPPPKN
jgi:hypothetical protein